MDTMPTIEDHLRGRPESVAEMFSQILSTAQDRGHADVEVIAKGVVLHGSRRIFAGLVPRDRGLRGMLNLLAPRQDARFTKSRGTIPETAGGVERPANDCIGRALRHRRRFTREHRFVHIA